MSAEKQHPSPISVMADIKEAVEVEKRISSSSRLALKDVLGKVVAEYNRLCTLKRHKVDSHRRALIYDLLLAENEGFH